MKLKGLGLDFMGESDSQVKAVMGKSDYELITNAGKAPHWITEAVAVIWAYRKILGREVTGGENGQPAYYWTMLDTGRINVADMAKEIYNSPEYKSKGVPPPTAQEINDTTTGIKAVSGATDQNTLIYAGAGIVGVGLLFAFLKGKLGGRKRR